MASSTRWLSAAAYAGMFVFGVVLALLGAVLPSVSARIGFDLARAGNLFLGMNFSMLVTMLALGPLMDRFGKKPPLAAGPVLVALALWLIGEADTFPALLAAVCLLGSGGGMVNGAANNLIADLHRDPMRKNAALNLLGIFFGFGAILLPFTVGSLLRALGLAPILWIAAALTLVTTAISAPLAFPPPHRRDKVPLAEVRRLARNPLVLTFGLLLFFESGNEFILAGYVSTYLARDVGASVSAASYLLALYWAAVIGARMALSRLLLRVPGTTTVMVSALAATLGVVMLLTARGEAMAAAALVVAGCGVATIFPTTLGLAGSRFEEYSGTVFGILFAIALTGGISLPWTLGELAAARGFRAALVLPAAGFLAIAALEVAIAKRTTTPPPRAPAG